MSTPKPHPPGVPPPMIPPEHVGWVWLTFDCPAGHAVRGEPCRPADPRDPWAEVCIPRILRALRNDIAAYRRRQQKAAERAQRVARARMERGRVR